MRLVRDWHAELARARMTKLMWRHAPWSELSIPIRRAWRDERAAEWVILELLDGRELAIEGRRMRHCVAIHARKCAAGLLSIWSLRRRWCDDGTTESVVTFSVHSRSRAITEMRAFANARPAAHHAALVQGWALRNGIRLAASVR